MSNDFTPLVKSFSDEIATRLPAIQYPNMQTNIGNAKQGDPEAIYKVMCAILEDIKSNDGKLVSGLAYEAAIRGYVNYPPGQLRRPLDKDLADVITNRLPPDHYPEIQPIIKHAIDGDPNAISVLGEMLNSKYKDTYKGDERLVSRLVHEAQDRSEKRIIHYMSTRQVQQ